LLLKNASSDLLQGTDLPGTLSQSFHGFCPAFLAGIFGHQPSDLMLDDECRRKLQLSSKPVRTHLALLSLGHEKLAKLRRGE
jgi:hypothetical protein